MEQSCCQIQPSPFCTSFRTLLHRAVRGTGHSNTTEEIRGLARGNPGRGRKLGPSKRTLRPESLARLSAPIDPPRPPPASFVHAKDRVCHSHEATCSPASRDPRPVRARVPSSALLPSSWCSGIVEPTRYWIDLPFHPPSSPKPGLTGPIVAQPAVHASSSSDTSRPAIEIRSTFRHLSADKLLSGGPQHTSSFVQLSRLSALTGSVSWLSLSPSFQSRCKTPLKRSERRATTTA